MYRESGKAGQSVSTHKLSADGDMPRLAFPLCYPYCLFSAAEPTSLAGQKGKADGHTDVDNKKAVVDQVLIGVVLWCRLLRQVFQRNCVG